MEILHRIFDWIGIPVLAGLSVCLFFAEEKFQLRKRVQSKWKRSVINNIVAIPSFFLLRFMFLPIMIWLTIKNEHLKFGLNYNIRPSTMDRSSNHLPCCRLYKLPVA